MSGIRDVVRDLLDGRENDEQITVEVSLLWSLLDAPPDEERLARALRKAPTLAPEIKWRTEREHAAAIARAYREDEPA